MPDRESVIKAIDICLGHGKCHDCHYSVAGAGYTAINCRECMMRDALKLLKEQEAVEPELEGGGSCWWHVCGECHGAIDASDRYCRHCGRGIKQDGHGGADIKEHSEGHGEGDPGGRAGDTNDGRGETDC